MKLQRWWWALVVVSLVIPLVSVEGRAEATVPGSNGYIAFESTLGDIGITDAEGTSTKNLTATPKVAERDPAWSPDGSRIAFSAGKEIYIMDSDGSGRTLMAGAPVRARNPTWSSDGQLISYDFFDGVANRIGLVDVPVGSTSQRTLTLEPAACPFKDTKDDYGTATILTCSAQHQAGPSFSPDGSSIAFVNTYIGTVEKCTYVFGDLAPSTDCATERFTRGSLSIMDPDGSQVRHVIEVYNNAPPSWSPDGTQLAFACAGSVCRTDLQGQLRLVTELGANPTWSPDGQEIFFDSVGYLFVTDVQTVQPSHYEKDISKGSNPDWQPRLNVAFCALRTIVNSGALAQPIGAGDLSSALRLLRPVTDAAYTHGRPVVSHMAPATTYAC